MCSFNKLLVSFVICLTMKIYQADAILCYQCNSNNNSACHELEDKGKLISPKPCPEIDPYNTTDYEVFNRTLYGEAFCRKNVMIYRDEEGYWLSRTTRGCGYVKTSKNRTQYRMANGGHEEDQYQCYTDGCNEGSTLRIASLFIAILPSMLIKIVIG